MSLVKNASESCIFEESFENNAKQEKDEKMMRAENEQLLLFFHLHE